MGVSGTDRCSLAGAPAKALASVGDAVTDGAIGTRPEDTIGNSGATSVGLGVSGSVRIPGSRPEGVEVRLAVVSAVVAAGGAGTAGVAAVSAGLGAVDAGVLGVTTASAWVTAASAEVTTASAEPGVDVPVMARAVRVAGVTAVGVSAAAVGSVGDRSDGFSAGGPAV